MTTYTHTDTLSRRFKEIQKKNRANKKHPNNASEKKKTNKK